MHWIKSALLLRCRLAAGTLALLFATGAFAQATGGPQAVRTPAASTAPAPSPYSAGARYAVVLDAAHGGTDTGAHLGAGLEEKTFVLALTGRLRALLADRGIPVLLTRDADMDLTSDQRAQSMDSARAAACLSIHATAVGQGVHLFTSSLPPAAQPAGTRDFVPWQTAQAGFITGSLHLESEMDTALAHAQVPVLMGRTSLSPLDSATCPAVAVEVAPLNAQTPVTDQKYQQQIADALATALVAWRTDWRTQP
ncbi:MAG: N-acetylmuramoyl-L-alanine amidase family protein [Acidobacteriaceae bacterium]